MSDENGIQMKLSNNQFLKKAALVTAVYLLMPESAEALTAGAGAGGATGIVGIDNLWGKISPYLAGAFSVDGIVYSAPFQE